MSERKELYPLVQAIFSLEQSEDFSGFVIREQTSRAKHLITIIDCLSTRPFRQIQFDFTYIIHRKQKPNSEKVLEDRLSEHPRTMYKGQTCLHGRFSEIFSKSNCMVFEQMITFDGTCWATSEIVGEQHIKDRGIDTSHPNYRWIFIAKDQVLGILWGLLVRQC